MPVDKTKPFCLPSQPLCSKFASDNTASLHVITILLILLILLIARFV